MASSTAWQTVTARMRLYCRHAAKPLGDFDVAQYQRLFDLQEVGRMKQATREMGRLENDILKGHLLSQRYLHRRLAVKLS